jgi:hypothetical protein
MNIFEAFVPAIYVLPPGLIVTGIGLIGIVRRMRFLHRGCRTKGTVLSFEERYPFGPTNTRGIRALPCFLPKIRFMTPDGDQYDFVEKSASRFLSSQVGRHIPVVYDPQDPRDAYVDHWLTLWSQLIGLTAFGIVLLGLGLSILLV